MRFIETLLNARALPATPKIIDMLRVAFCTDVTNVAEWTNQHPYKGPPTPRGNPPEEYWETPTRGRAVPCDNPQEWEAWSKRDDGAWRSYLKSMCPVFGLPFPIMWFEWGAWHRNEPAPAGGGATVLYGILLFKMKMPPDVSPEACGCFFEAYEDGSDLTSQVIRITQIESCIDEVWRGDEGDLLAETLKPDRDGAETILPALSAISFFHCRNVEIVVTRRARKLERKLARRYGSTMPLFHIIEVHKSMRRSRAEKPRELGGNVIGHFVRGHFKSYEGTYFGNRSGTWWWADHVAGDGAPVKNEYRVWAPSREHTPKCIVKP
jgi:hypothetical protein